MAGPSKPMGLDFRPVARRLTLIAASGDRFSTFAPYVPAVRDDGAVAFQARLAGGGSGVFVGLGGEPDAVFEIAPGYGAIVSHPDLDQDGAACFYAQIPGERPSLCIAQRGQIEQIASGCGPLGPTIGRGGEIAFRAGDGVEAGIFLWRHSRVTEIARAESGTAGFEGLPVVGAGGSVLYRATLDEGSHEVHLYADAVTRIIARTDEQLVSLAKFPMVNSRDQVVFGAARVDGRSGLYAEVSGAIACRALSGDVFESIRGGLLSDRGTLLLIATTRGGGLGVFADTTRDDPILAIGSPLLGSAVADFGLNPVSVNAHDQVAVRVALADGREAIVRSDPINPDPPGHDAG